MELVNREVPPREPVVYSEDEYFAAEEVKELHEEPNIPPSKWTYVAGEMVGKMKHDRDLWEFLKPRTLELIQHIALALNLGNPRIWKFHVKMQVI